MRLWGQMDLVKVRLANVLSGKDGYDIFWG